MNPNPKKTTYTPAAVSANGIAAALTGAGPFTTLSAPGPADSLEHQVSLQSAANLSAISVTITGTDANDNVISETRAGPNANTVLTTKYFKTVTAPITVDATLGVNTMAVGWGAPARTRWENIDYRQNGFALSVAVAISAGVANYDMQHTYDVPLTDSNAAIPYTALAAQTTNRDVQYVAPIGSVRVLLNTNTGATVIHYVFQGERS